MEEYKDEINLGDNVVKKLKGIYEINCTQSSNSMGKQIILLKGINYSNHKYK